MNMSEQIANCEQCLERYNLFRRRKQCHLCGQTFCSKCISKTISSISSSNTTRACVTCLLIRNERTTSDQLALIRVKHLRAYLVHSKIVSRNRLESCLEKQDLINLIQSRKQQTPDETYVFVERSNGRHTTPPSNQDTATSNEQSTVDSNEQASTPIPTASTSSNELPSETVLDPSPPPPPPPPPPKASPVRKALSDLSSLESIDSLTVGQLKDILAQNFVSFKGCVEKTELITKVQLLYRDKQQQSDSSTFTSLQQSDENLCKICMDAMIDCVFLDCGHLCTCVQCGKQLSECPLCRSYIIRVVRVFKS